MTTSDDDDLTETDRAALQLALDLTLADDPPDEGRVEQVTHFLRERDWYDVASFCSYVQQTGRLNLFPWQKPPCWIITDEQADAILAAGPQLSATTGEDIGDRRCARLLKRMLSHDISPYHPNPLQAIAEAKRAKHGARRGE